MRWKVSKHVSDGFDFSRVIEADALDVRDGLLIFGRGRLVCDFVPTLILNRDAWTTLEEVKEPSEEKTP